MNNIPTSPAGAVVSPAGFHRPETPVDQALKALRDNDRCPKCGGWMSVMNIATRGFKAERITVETHCVCIGGPARDLYQPARENAGL